VTNQVTNNKIERLHTPQAYADIIEAYKRNTIVECASIFKTSHETIRQILRKNGVKIRKKGEYTDDTKIQAGAYKCSNIIRQYPDHLHKEIIDKTAEFVL